MPGASKKAEEMSRPEATPEVIGQIRNGLSVELDDTADDIGMEDDDSSVMCPPSGNLLDQIFAIEANEHAIKLGVSTRAAPIKPLVPKSKKVRKSVEEVKDEEKKEKILEVIKEAEKDKSKPHEQIVMEAEQRHREKLENKQLLYLLTESLRKLPLDNHFEKDGTLVTPQMKLGLDLDQIPDKDSSQA